MRRIRFHADSAKRLVRDAKLSERIVEERADAICRGDRWHEADCFDCSTLLVYWDLSKSEWTLAAIYALAWLLR